MISMGFSGLLLGDSCPWPSLFCPVRQLLHQGLQEQERKG